MERLSHPTLDEVSNLLMRPQAGLTPQGAHRIRAALADLDRLYRAVGELGGMDVIRDAMLAAAVSEKPTKRK